MKNSSLLASRNDSIMDKTDAFFDKLNHAPAYKQLATEIARLVLSGKLKNGAPLPTEAILCEQFGVNRSTVREGIRLLEETGMVRRSGAKRLQISRPTHAEVGHQLERALLLHEITFYELWETAMLLEPRSAELAAAHLTESDLFEIEDNVRRTEDAMMRGGKLVELDIEFHSLLAKAMHNRVLQLTREPMNRLFYPVFDLVLNRVNDSGERLLRAHREILQALRTKVPERAGTWMRRHIQDFRRGYEAAGLDVREAINPNIELRDPCRQHSGELN